jgi:uroporphyrin-III C-methyltransferase
VIIEPTLPPPPPPSPAQPTRLHERSESSAATKPELARSLQGLPWPFIAAVVLALTCLLSLSVAWKVQQRLGLLEQTLVSRQEASQRDASQAQMLAKQSNDRLLEAVAKVALLEARVAEVTVQRGQFEELLQSLSRSRDENVLVDIEAGLRVALQQAVITGSAEPVVAVLKQSDERLARYDQPRLEGVRRAIARDLEKIKALSVTDVATLSARLDEVVRWVDEMTLLSRADFRKASARAERADAHSSSEAVRPTNPTPNPASWWAQQGWSERWSRIVEHIFEQVHSLVRVTRIDHPEAMLLAPDEAFFLRENLKLRLLNARLALLSRQFETARSDLQLVLLAFDRYFDRQSKRTSDAADAVRSVASQTLQVVVPRPDNTLAALSATGSIR